MPRSIEYYLLSLGTNLGDRLANLKAAIRELTVLSSLQLSSVYEAEALLPKDAEPDWDLPYFNMAVSGYSDMNPQEMLYYLKSIEKKLGRDSHKPRWSPRIIDIDILVAGNTLINSASLTIPHPEMLERGFVLVPAVEIASHIKHPISQKTLQEHLSELSLTILNSIKKIPLGIDANDQDSWNS